MFAIRIAVFALLAGPSFTQAHYHMLLPNKSEATTGEQITFAYQLGHPYEHEFFDTTEPEFLYLISPAGEKVDLKKDLKKIAVEGVGGKKVTGYQFKFTPTKRGDYTIVAVSPRMKVEGEKFLHLDVTKVVLHVQTQKGWKNIAVEEKVAPFEILPLTRPYGLTAGTAIHVEVVETKGNLDTRRPVSRCELEIEKYNAVAPKLLPAEELVTKTALTSRAGESVVTLGEAGWWSITAVADSTNFGAHCRCTYWIHVGPASK